LLAHRPTPKLENHPSSAAHKKNLLQKFGLGRPLGKPWRKWESNNKIHFSIYGVKSVDWSGKVSVALLHDHGQEYSDYVHAKIEEFLN